MPPDCALAARSRSARPRLRGLVGSQLVSYSLPTCGKRWCGSSPSHQIVGSVLANQGWVRWDCGWARDGRLRGQCARERAGIQGGRESRRGRLETVTYPHRRAVFGHCC
ncbi:unnamed protein product [Caretta caretta]